MNSHRNSKIFAFLVANLILLSLVGTSAIAPFIPPAGQMKVTNTAQLLQFTSSGYALGFTPNGMYATNGSHALHVNFIDANPVQPQSDSSLSVEGKVVPLGSITYANLWKGVSLTYTASPGSIYTTI